MIKLKDIQHSGFKTPKDYFESLDETILNSIHENSLTEKVSESGMHVPKNYFETLDDAIIAKVSEQETSTKVIPLFSNRNLIYLSGIAAALVIMLTIYTNQNITSFDSLDVELVENYLLDQNINSYEFASLLTIEDLSNDTFIDTQIQEEFLENYLLENTDLEELIID